MTGTVPHSGWRGRRLVLQGVPKVSERRQFLKKRQSYLAFFT